ncbi:rcc01693 family protein [Rhizobium sp. SSA_523]|uniref:rcc01693 family protein n=1 Tax=Rhizobium sp. SSA_523 TaxID=2952477 RepID=UPI00209103A2|nr:rcc01693 family protein [Rhizobium sp. SSA_523]MCO5730903.1 phage tail assembly chaperone [Rhizobium sp. SSA_523]WKC25852.1 phage tail assembly chaperone [Rhizobium sp. SSA_523]
MSAAGGGTDADGFWPAIQHLGLCLLRLPPAAFWQLTPGEVMAMAGGLALSPSRLARLERRDLQALMARFPDD